MLIRKYFAFSIVLFRCHQRKIKELHWVLLKNYKILLFAILEESERAGCDFKWVPTKKKVKYHWFIECFSNSTPSRAHSVLNDALRIVTGCLRPTPTDNLHILSGIQPAELHRLGAALSLAHRGSLDPDHILYGLLSGSPDTRQVRLRPRRPFVPAARNLLDNLAGLSIRASKWKNHKWKAEYCENVSRLRVFVPGIGARPVGMGLPQAAWIKLNRLWTGVG